MNLRMRGNWRNLRDGDGDGDGNTEHGVRQTPLCVAHFSQVRQVDMAVPASHNEDDRNSHTVPVVHTHIDTHIPCTHTHTHTQVYIVICILEARCRRMILEVLMMV